MRKVKDGYQLDRSSALGPIRITKKSARAAALKVCELARSAEDAKFLLEALGLTERLRKR